MPRGIDFFKRKLYLERTQGKTIPGLTAWGLPARGDLLLVESSMEREIALHQRERRMASLLIKPA